MVAAVVEMIKARPATSGGTLAFTGLTSAQLELLFPVPVTDAALGRYDTALGDKSVIELLTDIKKVLTPVIPKPQPRYYSTLQHRQDHK